MASIEEIVQQEQHDHDARQAGPFADLETQDGRTIGEIEEQQGDDDEPADTPPDPEGEALFDRSAYDALAVHLGDLEVFAFKVETVWVLDPESL